MKRKTFFPSFLAIALLIVLLIQLQGGGAVHAGAHPCDVSWDTAASGNWSVAGNWSPAAVPAAGDDVCIEVAGTYTVTLDVNSANILSLTLDSTDATLLIDVGNTLTMNGGTRKVDLNDGTLEIDGTFNLTSGDFNFNGGAIASQVNITGGALNIGVGSNGAGTFSMRRASTISGDIAPDQTVLVNGEGNVPANLTATGDYTNDGTITLENIALAGASNLTINSTLTNNGTINVEPGTGGSRTIDGGINNTATGLVNIDATTTFSETNGVYTNNGTIDIASTPAEPAVRTLFIIGNGQFTTATPGNIAGGGIIHFMGSADFFATGNIEADVIIASGSTMNPGTTPGIANEDGAYSHGASGVLNIEIGGPDPGTGFDQLNITGNMVQDGTLNVTTINAFVPNPCQRFPIVTYGSFTGNFDTINLTAPAGMFYRADVGPTGIVVVAMVDGTLVSVFPTTVGVTEDGATADYNMCLGSANPPGALVTVTPAPDAQVTVLPTSVTFDPASDDWKETKQVTVTAVDDAVFEGPHTGTITHSSASGDGAFDGLTIDSVTANITDNDLPSQSIEVVKALIPPSDPGRFDLQIDSADVVTNVGDAGTTGPQTVTPATHTVGETGGDTPSTNLADYNSSVQCVEASNAAPPINQSGAGPVNVLVAAEEQWVCTITNTRKTGTIEVVKDLNPAIDPGRFDLQIDGADEATNAGDGGSTGAKTVPTGDHTVGETGGDTPPTNLADYNSSIQCLEGINGATPINQGGAGPVNVLVAEGDQWVCTITNTRKTGTIEVVKDLDPASDPGRFDLQIDGADELTNAGNGGSTGAKTVPTGDHTVGETGGDTPPTNLADYNSGVDCVEAGGPAIAVPGIPIIVPVAEGDQWVCTITNIRKTGTIEVVKDLDPAGDPGRFDLQIDGGDEATNAGNGGSTGAVTLNTGTHTVGETGGDAPLTDLNDYTSSIQCLENSNSASPINQGGPGPVNVPVEEGDQWVCTITNTLLATTGTIEVVKNLIPAGDPGRFDLQIDGADEQTNAGNGGSTGVKTVNAGSHTVGETGGSAPPTNLSDYNSSIQCLLVNDNGALINQAGAGPLNVPVVEGDQWLCTISNTRKTGTIEVVKALIPAGDPGRFDLQIDGNDEQTNAGNGGSTGPQTVNTGTHTVGETGGSTPPTNLNDYTSSIECLETNAPPINQAGAGPVNVPVAEGDQWVCTITNTVDETTGTIEVVKNLVPTDDPGRFDLQIDGVDEATNAGHNGTTGVKIVPTGSHSVGETGGDSPPTDLNDYGRSVECLEDSNTASPINKSGSGPVNVPVEDGDVWVCTITNDGTFVPPPPVGGITAFFGGGSGSAGLSGAGSLYGIAVAVIGIVAAGAWYARRQRSGKGAA